jgi:hypothetical protein
MNSIEWLALALYENAEMKAEGGVIDQIVEEAKKMHRQETIKFGYDCIAEVVDSSGELIYNKVPEEVYQENLNKK